MFHLPLFTLPTPIARIAAQLPQQPPTLALVCALNVGLDRIVPREQLEALAEHPLCMQVKDAGLTLYFQMRQGRFHLYRGTQKPALTIRANARDFMALALRQEDPDTLFFSRRLVMEGDTDLGLLVKNTLDAIDWSKFTQYFPNWNRLKNS